MQSVSFARLCVLHLLSMSNMAYTDTEQCRHNLECRETGVLIEIPLTSSSFNHFVTRYDALPLATKEAIQTFYKKQIKV